MLGFLLCVKGIKIESNDFGFVPLTFADCTCKLRSFCRPMHLRFLPETAENFGGIEYGITGKKIL